jgi:hypothetical protein
MRPFLLSRTISRCLLVFKTSNTYLFHIYHHEALNLRVLLLVEATVGERHDCGSGCGATRKIRTKCCTLVSSDGFVMSERR